MVLFRVWGYFILTPSEWFCFGFEAILYLLLVNGSVSGLKFMILSSAAALHDQDLYEQSRTNRVYCELHVATVLSEGVFTRSDTVPVTVTVPVKV